MYWTVLDSDLTLVGLCWIPFSSLRKNCPLHLLFQVLYLCFLVPFMCVGIPSRAIETAAQGFSRHSLASSGFISAVVKNWFVHSAVVASSYYSSQCWLLHACKGSDNCSDTFLESEVKQPICNHCLLLQKREVDQIVLAKAQGNGS